MRYFIPSILAIIAGILTICAGYAVIMAFSDQFLWVLVAVGIGLSAFVAILATKEAFRIMKDF